MEESESSLIMSARTSVFGTYSYDFESGKAYYSEDFLLLFGLSSSETPYMDSDPLAKVMHPDDRPKFLEAMRLANDPEGTGILDIDFRIILGNGSMRWLRTLGRTVIYSHKAGTQSLMVRGIVQDITEGKKSEEALRRSEERWRKLVTTIPDYIAIHDLQGRYVFLNHYAEGFSEADVVGRSVYEFISDESKDEFRRYFEACIATVQPQRFSYSAFGDNRSVRFYESYFVPILEHEKLVHILSIAIDITDRNRIEAEMHLHSELVKHVTLGVAIINTSEGKFIYTNTRFDEMFGYEKGELTGKGYSVINYTGDKSTDEIEAEVVKGLSLNGEWHGETRNLRKNGDSFWTYADISVMQHPVLGNLIITTLTDITERIETEKTLAASEAGFRSLFENSHFGISVVSADGNLIRANTALARMYGYDNPEMMIREVGHVRELLADLSKRKELITTLNDTDQVMDKEIEVLKRDGLRFFVLISIRNIRNENGEILYRYGTHLDLTERKKNEGRMRDASLYSRSLIEANLDPMVTIDNAGKITDVNRATELITGFNREKLTGTDFSDYFTEPQKAREGYRTAFINGLLKDYPLTILNTNGREIDVLYNATVFRNEAGEVQGILAAARDITLLKRMEEELRNSNKRLEDLNRHLHDVWENEKTVIAMNLHDDLGQRLTAMNMDLAWIKKRIGEQPAPVNVKLKELSLSVEETIESIKETSGLLSSRMLLELGLFDSIKLQLRKFEKQSGIKCKFSSDGKESEIGDFHSLILYRILQECLTNIARHSQASAAKVHIETSDSDINFTIKDNGTGIDESKIFSLKSMGLAGIRERARLVDGIVMITSKMQLGTLVRISIPIKKTSNG